MKLPLDVKWYDLAIPGTGAATYFLRTTSKVKNPEEISDFLELSTEQDPKTMIKCMKTVGRIMLTTCALGAYHNAYWVWVKEGYNHLF